MVPEASEYFRPDGRRGLAVVVVLMLVLAYDQPPCTQALDRTEAARIGKSSPPRKNCVTH